jgi:hypothetical protein
MDRLRAPTEFGFPTAPYVPREHPRPIWKTIVFGALLALIPLVGPGISAVYIDRRRIPGTFEPGEALRSAFIQAGAIVALAALVWIVFIAILGFGVGVDVSIARQGL